MKILIFILLLLSVFMVNSQNLSLMKYLRVLQFKNDRNPDFGISLPSNGRITNGILNDNLGSDNLPEYCCGDQSKYSDPYPELLIVHNSSTFDQWFKPIIQNGDYCRNYQLLIPATITIDSDKLVINVSPNQITNALDGNGFNNITKYPEYTDDPDMYMFCYELELNLVPNSSGTKNFNIQTPGEYWIFVDGVLFTQKGGVSQSGLSYSNQVTLPDRELKLNIFGCSRSNYLTSIYYTLYYFDINCDIDPVCQTCGSGGCEAIGCDDDLTSCIQSISDCGACFTSERNCDDDDPCTIDSCTEGLGCQHDVSDPSCYCNDETCRTVDACFPRYCSDLYNCTTEPIVCIGSETCFEPHCEFGECVCSTNPPVTITTTTITATTTASTTATTTTATTTATTTTATTTTATTTSSTISSTTSPNPPPFICDDNSCPHHYCCVQLQKSFTCVSKYFEEQCNPFNLKQFY